MHPDIEHLLSQPFGSLPELIARQAALRPGHKAVILEGQSLDYAALCAGMNRVAASLQRDGLGPGDVLAICAGASIEYVLAYLGALRAIPNFARMNRGGAAHAGPGPRPRPGGPESLVWMKALP